MTVRLAAIVASGLLVLMAGCEQVPWNQETAQQVLVRFCSLHQSALGQYWLNPTLHGYAEALCRSVGLGLGTPG